MSEQIFETNLGTNKSTNRLRSKFTKNVAAQIKNYDPPITRRFLEGLLGVSLGTVQKLEHEGHFHPEKKRFGNSIEVATYQAQEFRSLINKRGNPLVRENKTQVISVFSMKGGVGKTAFTQHIGSFLSLFGRTLIIDIDAQADTTVVLGVDAPASVELDPDAPSDPTIAELLNWQFKGDLESPYRRLKLEDVRKELSETLHVIPSDLEIGEINYSLNRLPFKTKILSDGLEVPGELYILKDFIDSISSQYDFILIDCPPNIETFNIAALLASNRILIPVELEAKCVRTMRRNTEFLEKLQNLLPVFAWEKILVVPNKFRNEGLKLKALAKLQDTYGDTSEFVLSEAIIPYSAVIDRCSASKQPIFVPATGIGISSRAVTDSAKKLSDLFWIVIHELLDVELDRVLFNNAEQPEVL